MLLGVEQLREMLTRKGPAGIAIQRGSLGLALRGEIAIAAQGGRAKRNGGLCGPHGTATRGDFGIQIAATVLVCPGFEIRGSFERGGVAGGHFIAATASSGQLGAASCGQLRCEHGDHQPKHEERLPHFPFGVRFASSEVAL